MGDASRERPAFLTIDLDGAFNTYGLIAFFRAPLDESTYSQCGKLCHRIGRR